MAMTRFLILSCSERKRPDLGLVPAIERYDGPAFRVLRRFLQSQPPDPPEVYILSAELGLVSSMELIPNYDRRMTLQRAQELRAHVVGRLRDIINRSYYRELFICVGRNYLRALDGYDTTLSPNTSVTVLTESFGRKLAALRDWLYGGPPQPREGTLRRKKLGNALLCGVELRSTPEEVLDVARQAILLGNCEATRCRRWCVMVDGHTIAPKWLVSQLTGLPVSTFVSRDARRALEQLGVQIVERWEVEK